MVDEAAIKKKKLPFKPTALLRKAREAAKAAEASAPVEANHDDLFYRGKEMEKIIEADTQRRMLRKKRQEEERKRKAEEQEERERKWERDAEEAAEARTPMKKGEAVLDDEESPSFGGSHTLRNESFGDGTPLSPPPSKRSRTDVTSSAEPPVHSPSVHVLDDSNDEDGEALGLRQPLARSASHRSTGSGGSKPLRAPTRVPAQPTNAISLDSDSEPESRPDVKGKGVARDHPSPSPPPPPEVDQYQHYIDAAEARRREQAKAGRSTTFLQVLVNSTIPGAQPLTFRLRTDQPLRVMRNHWAAQQQQRPGTAFPRLGAADVDELVITFDKARVFPDSSLQILGIRGDAEGNLAGGGHGAQDGDALLRGGRGVILEIWTRAEFRQMEIAEETRRRRETGELEEDGEAQEAAEEEEEEESQPLKVKLVAKGMEVVRASVKPEYSVETLASVFRKTRGVPSSTEVTLFFDGDRLEEHMTIEDADIQDMDTIEVYLK